MPRRSRASGSSPSRRSRWTSPTRTSNSSPKAACSTGSTSPGEREEKRPMASVNRRVLPGFSLSLGYTVFYLTILVLLPILACFSKAASLTLGEFWAAVWTERTRAAYALTFGTSLVAATLNVLLGLLVAWVLVRYRFPGR